MSKKEMMEKIRRNQAREKARHTVDWVYTQLRELSDYLEMGTDTSLREKCLHALRWLLDFARRNDKGFQAPWYVTV